MARRWRGCVLELGRGDVADPGAGHGSSDERGPGLGERSSGSRPVEDPTLSPSWQVPTIRLARRARHDSRRELHAKPTMGECPRP